MLAALLGLCISFHPCGGTAGLFLKKKGTAGGSRQRNGEVISSHIYLSSYFVIVIF